MSVNYFRVVFSLLKNVKSFLGLAGYYKKFVQNSATIASPLIQLTYQVRGFSWGKAQNDAHAALCNSLCDLPVLVILNWQESFYLEVDASNVGIGAVIRQGHGVVEYGSKALTESDEKYSTTEKDIFSAVYFCDKFRYYLTGSRFVLVTDHEPFVFLYRRRDPHHRYAR